MIPFTCLSCLLSLFPQLGFKFHETGVFVLFLLYPKHWPQCLVSSRCSVNVSHLGQMSDLVFSVLSPAFAQCWLYSSLTCVHSFLALCLYLVIISLYPSESTSLRSTSSRKSFLIQRVLLFEMLFVPVISVNSFCLLVKLLLCWKTVMGYSHLPHASLWNMLIKFINECKKPNMCSSREGPWTPSGCTKWAAALGCAHPCPPWALEMNAPCLQEVVHGNFYFSNVPVFLKGISLICNKARVAKISTAHHGRREWAKNSETEGLWGAQGVSFLFGFHFHISFLFPPFGQTEFLLEGQSV